MSYRDANFGFQIIEKKNKKNKKTKKNKKKQHKKDILCKMAIQGAFVDDSHKV